MTAPTSNVSKHSSHIIKPHIHLIKTYTVRVAETNQDITTTPTTYLKAIHSPKATEWLKAIKAEHNAIQQTNTYKLINLPNSCKALSSKTVFKLKLKANRTTNRYKAHVVVKGCSQQEGINYIKTYTPVLHYKSLRFLLALAVQLDLKIHQMDMDSAFLQANLDNKIYIHQPEGFIDPKHLNKVWRLLKSLYRLKQVPLVWNQTINGHLHTNSFHPTNTNPCIYMHWEQDQITIIMLYINDLIIITHSKLLVHTKKMLSAHFPIKDLQEPTSILRIEILCNHKCRRLKLHQSGHITSILTHTTMTECKAISTPMEPSLHLKTIASTPAKCAQLPYQQVIGMLLFIACTTRWDIGYTITYLCHFVNAYNQSHWKVAKCMLRYLQGT